jgi:sugar lactone lactonase YvrE
MALSSGLESAAPEQRLVPASRYSRWRVDRVVDLPISQLTSCAFGGPNLDILYVTSATNRLSPGELSRQPLAGRLLALDVGAKGLPEPFFAG